MGQMGSSANLACAQSCKDWGEKDYSTVKVDLQQLRAMDCLQNDDPLSCFGKDENDTAQGKGELVTDKENAPPNDFKVPKLNLPEPGGDESKLSATTASTAASTSAPTLQQNEKFQWSIIDDSNAERESVLSPSAPSGDAGKIEKLQARQKMEEMDAEKQLLAADLAEQQSQRDDPKLWTSESEAAAFELKVTRMGWSQTQHSLVRREVVAIPSGVDVHPALKVGEFKNLLKDQKLVLKTGEVINTEDMVLTTPRELAVGGALNDDKTLGEAGVGPQAPELLLLHADSVRKASCGGRKPSPRVAATQSNSDSQWQEVKQKKLEEQAKEEERFAEQQQKVNSWLKSNGFKDVNELVRKRLTKSRPLHVAVGKGDEEMVKLLLIMGADPRLCNGKSETPLLLAKRLERSGSVGPGAGPVVSALEERISAGFSPRGGE